MVTTNPTIGQADWGLHRAEGIGLRVCGISFAALRRDRGRDREDLAGT